MSELGPNESPYTDRSLVILQPNVRERDRQEVAKWFESNRRLRTMSGARETTVPKFFRDFDVAMLPASSITLEDSFAELAALGIRWVEPERKVYSPELLSPEGRAVPFDALRAIRADTSRLHGNRITVAVLDTGLHFKHPDFVTGRTIEQASFVRTSAPQDGHGHGTHCTGLACGPRTAAGSRPAYGVADQTRILVGKVLDDDNSGVDSDVIAGLEWAASRGADVIALCLSATTSADVMPSIVFEHIARVLLKRGHLVIAAAGEDDRRLSVGPVQHPANCNSIMAIGMLNVKGEPHFRSPGLAPAGDPIDLCAPGENIYSAALSPANYVLRSGTSMATALTAGVAALWAETDEKLRGLALWQKLVDTATPLPNFRKAGLGLVQAPQ